MISVMIQEVCCTLHACNCGLLGSTDLQLLIWFANLLRLCSCIPHLKMHLMGDGSCYFATQDISIF